jgi:hypothetical protein
MFIGHKNGTTRISKWKPFAARRRTLFGFAFYLIALVVAISVLYRSADQSALHQKVFIYRTNIKKLGRLGAFTPFSIIPTLLAVVVGLCYDSIDKTYRALQPFVSISTTSAPISTDAKLSYQSSYWLWTSGKAACNKYWH